jgi:primosomal protein N' (replication factor Y)
MPLYCEVALPVPLDRTFTYLAHGGSGGTRPSTQPNAPPRPGSRVIVPFRNEKLIGVITELHSRTPTDFEAKPIDSVLDQEPILSRQLLDLAAWMAQYYLAPLGEVLRGMLPLGVEVRRTVSYRITDHGRDMLAGSFDGEGRKTRLSPEEQDAERKVLTRLADGEAVKLSTLRTATAATLPLLASLVRKKWIARENAAVERDARRLERFAILIPEARLPELTDKQQAILAEIAACDGQLPLIALEGRGLSPSSLQTLVRRGLVRIEERPASFSFSGIGHVNPTHALNEPQMEALASIATAQGFQPFLLHGVTGSGKTAVYLAAMQRALDRGQSAILLVPEIGLTPAAAAQLDATFGRSPPLRAHPRRALRAVAPHPARRRPHRRRHPLRHLRSNAQPRPHPRR